MAICLHLLSFQDIPPSGKFWHINPHWIFESRRTVATAIPVPRVFALLAECCEDLVFRGASKNEREVLGKD